MLPGTDVLLTVDLEGNGLYSFRTLDEIENWLSSEKDFWGWLRDQSSHPPVNQCWSNYTQCWNNINNALQAARQHLELSDFSEMVQQIGPHFNLYNSCKLFHASNPTSLFIEKLKERNPLVAAFALCYLQNEGINPQMSQSVEGVFEALKYREGITSNIENEKTRLDELSRSYVELREKYRLDYDKLRNDFNAIAEEIGGIRAEQTVSFDKLLKDSGDKLAEIQDVYDKKLSLQSSVTYWRNKYKKHLLFSGVFGVVSFLSVWIGFKIIKTQYNEVLAQALSATSLSQKTEYLRVAMIVIVVTFVLWFIRILVRILLSHIHLGTDANERVTMLQTYLALMREGDNLKENDKQLILQTLFRPSTDGIVKDDGVPPSIAELLSKMGSSK